MRGLAYGILDPAGERYQLAMIHGKSSKSYSAHAEIYSLSCTALSVPRRGSARSSSVVATPLESRVAGVDQARLAAFALDLP